METKYKALVIIKVTLLSSILSVLLSADLFATETENSNPNQSSQYLEAVREFADNVLKYGRDTYGPKHTPLFVDGLNIHNHEPVRWRAPNGDKWIVSNLASQQNLLRTLNGLTKITGDSKYRQAAVEAVKYALEHLQSPNGLLYWGGHIAYDALGDKVSGRGPGNNHELKYNFPYYELMWQVDPRSTKRYLESFWSAHILDWSNLDMNRHGSTERTLEEPWVHKYEGGSVFFWGDGLTFINTGSDLFYAAAMLSILSGQQQPLIWAKRLAYRYVETRNPETGIGGFQYSQCSTAYCCGPSIRGDRAQYQYGDDFKGHFVVEGTLFPCYGNTPQVAPRICEFLLGERLGAEGKEFTRWALEELTAWGKIAYRKEDNSWIPMLTDGTSMEGYVCKKDGYFGPKGRVIKAGHGGPASFWTYALAFRTTADPFMWEMARYIAQGNNLGDIGTDPETGPDLEMDADCSSTYALLGFLELYKKEKNTVFLKMARHIGDNILSNQFYKGFFVPSKRHTYTRFDCYEPLALLHLHAATKSEPDSVPWVWPSSSFLACEYYGRGTAYDTSLIYTLKDSVEPPMTPRVAAAVGDLDELRTLLSKKSGTPSDRYTTLNNLLRRAAEAGHTHVVEFLLAKGAEINSGTTTALHYAVQNSHRDVIEFLLAKGAKVNAKDGAQQTPIDLAVRRNRKDIIKLLVDRGAEITSIRTAIQLGDSEKVKVFLKQGTEVNAKDLQGNTPLYYAVLNKDKDMVELLIASGADVNATNRSGDSLLAIATRRRRRYPNHLKVVKLLIANGADVNAKDESGYTPLYGAIWGKDKDTLRLLLDKGADANVIPAKDLTPLGYVAWDGDKEMAELLIAHGAELELRDSGGYTALRNAAAFGRRDLVELFVSKGADISDFHVAACLGDLARVKEYIEQGVDIDARDEMDWTPLYWAVSTSQKDVVWFLIANGARVDVTTKNNRTLLHQAALSGDKTLEEFFISKGADVNAKDNAGRTPLWHARERGHTEIVELLRNHGAKE